MLFRVRNTKILKDVGAADCVLRALYDFTLFGDLLAWRKSEAGQRIRGAVPAAARATYST
jgi:hypothetical protein